MLINYFTSLPNRKDWNNDYQCFFEKTKVNCNGFYMAIMLILSIFYFCTAAVMMFSLQCPNYFPDIVEKIWRLSLGVVLSTTMCETIVRMISYFGMYYYYQSMRKHKVFDLVVYDFTALLCYLKLQLNFLVKQANLLSFISIAGIAEFLWLKGHLDVGNSIY